MLIVSGTSKSGSVGKQGVKDSSIQNTSVSAGEKNALREAKKYLQSPFSGGISANQIIYHLEREGYSHSEATYAIDNCGANWNEQAVKTAQYYLSLDLLTPLSKEDVVETLVLSEKFTEEQAEYGVAQTGFFTSDGSEISIFEEAAKNTLGDNYSVKGTQSIEIEFMIDSWNEEWMVNTLHDKIANYCDQLVKTSRYKKTDYDRIHFYGMASVVDIYGNESTAEVAIVALDKAVIEKVNWPSFNYDNFAQISVKYYLADALK